jgi:hypothetical protein
VGWLAVSKFRSLDLAGDEAWLRAALGAARRRAERRECLVAFA